MKIIHALVAIIAIAGVGWLIWWNSAHPQISFLHGFFAAQIPSAITLALIAYRNRFLSGYLIPFSVALRGNGLAIMGTFFLPARLGDFGKPFYFNSVCQFPVIKGLSLVVEERIWDFVALAIYTVVTLLIVGDSAESKAIVIGSRLSICVAVVGVTVLILLPKIKSRLPFLSKIEEKYGVFTDRSWRHMLKAMLISMFIWGGSILTLISAYHFSGLPSLRLDQLMFLFVASTLGLVISITPGSIGTYEGAIVGVLYSYGVKWDMALAFAIGFRLCWMAVPLIISIIALLSDGKTLVNWRTRNKTQP